MRIWIALLLLVLANVSMAKQRQLYLYNWSEYMPDEVIAQFENVHVSPSILGLSPYNLLIPTWIINYRVPRDHRNPPSRVIKVKWYRHSYIRWIMDY